MRLVSNISLQRAANRRFRFLPFATHLPPAEWEPWVARWILDHLVVPIDSRTVEGGRPKAGDYFCWRMVTKRDNEVVLKFRAADVWYGFCGTIAAYKPIGWTWIGKS